jgi:hypothetical protein
MNFTDHRQLKTKISIMTLYAPERGYLGGYFPGATPAEDPQNLTSFAFRNNYNDSSIKANMAGHNESNTVEVKSLGKVSSNLSPINQLQGALMPRVNTNTKAPSCTFVFGGIVKNELHPLYNYIAGPDSGYNATYTNSTKNIKTLSAGTAGTALTAAPLSYVAYVPFNDSDINKLSKTFTTYNIWDLTDEYYGKEQRICDKYVGPVINPSANNGASITAIHDPNDGEKIKVSAIDTTVKIQRIFPTSKDIIYQNPKYFYEYEAENWKSVDLSAKGTYNCGFVLKFDSATAKDKSQIIINITDKTPTKNTVNSYQITFNDDNKQTLFIREPNGTNYIEYGKFTKLGSLFSLTELYIHFVGGIMLVGINPDPTDWEVVFPYTNTLNDDKRKYDHMISSETYVSVLFNDVDCVFQYSPIVFNHIDKNVNDQNSLMTYISSKFDAPNTKLAAINTDQISANVLDNIYYGSIDKNIDTYVHPVTIYGDYRTKGAFKITNTGIQPNGNMSSNNNISLISTGRIDGSIYVRLDNNDSNTPTSQFSNNTINSNSDISTSSAASVANSVATAAYKSNATEPILQFLTNGDLSEYTEAWNVDVSCSEKNSFHINKSATLTLKNLDSDSRGARMFDLLSRNLLVIKIEAGYGDVFETYFEGFCTQISVEKSGSESVFRLNCEDIMSYALNHTYFETPMLITGLSIFRAVDYIIACSGFADHYWRFNGNNAFNKYGALKLDSNSIQKQDLITCTFTDTILDKIKQVATLLNNKATAFPTLRWDENNSKIIWDARYNYLDTDFKFLGTVETGSKEYLYVKNTMGTNIPDWHGLLNGGYKVEIENANISTGVKSFGLLLDGYKFIGTPEVKIEQSLSTRFRNIVNNGVETENLPVGYVGFRKIKIDAVDKASIANQTILENRFRYLDLISRDTFHTINFTCYVTKPLRPHGTFLVNILVNDKTSQTDPYAYQKVNYTFSKENNYITADVSGVNIIVPGDY